MIPCAVFWDQSFIWGLFVYDTLVRLRIPFDVVNAPAIRSGALENYAVLIIPGGWASHKKMALGPEGENAIRRFVHGGGNYIGFCGGAGLALSGENTLDMVPVYRLPLKKRLPSASGTVYIRLTPDHPVSRKFPETIRTNVWWPSQFDIEHVDKIHPIAFYEAIGDDFWVSDIPAKGMDSDRLQKFESIYGINLDPCKCFLGHPAIIEGYYGSGKLILSYPHLETPDDEEGNELFRQLLVYLEEETKKPYRKPEFSRTSVMLPCRRDYLSVERMIDKVKTFIELGESYLLWFWRKPWILGWKRGVRGLEYSMLMISLAFLGMSVLSLSEVEGRTNVSSVWTDRLAKLEALIDDFLNHAKKLLMLERVSSLDSPRSKIEKSSNSEMDKLRLYLFGRRMSHGGLCREIFDILDILLFDALVLLNNYNTPIRLHSVKAMLDNFS
ncbi:MAG: BPL-N domain-containing protein, partial [Thermodesulforhabdaceae bacterium]